MKEWIEEQFKFGRTICLYDKNWDPIFKINPIQYKDTLLNFIKNEYDPNQHHLVADNHNLYGKIVAYNYYTYYPDINNPLELYKIYKYLCEIVEHINKPHWRSLGNDSDIFPNEIMDIIWENYYSNIIVNKIDVYLNLLKDTHYRSYYIYYLLCWIEQNFNLIFSKLDYRNSSVSILLKNINEEIQIIKKKSYSFEVKCPQIQEFIKKWENNIFFKI